MRKALLFNLIFMYLLFGLILYGKDEYWHGVKRELRYSPGKKCIFITNGSKKFNRALYGTNTAFRVEAGDLPEFALYMPGMGGNIKLGLIVGDVSRWFTEFDTIKAFYKPGLMEYEIKDSIIGNALIKIEVLALAESEGCLIEVLPVEISNIKLVLAYGGVSLKRFPRSGDIGAEPESVFYMLPEYCKNNEFEIEGNLFRTYLRNDRQRKLVSTSIVPNGSVIKISDCTGLESPLILANTEKKLYPVVVSITSVNECNTLFYLISKPEISVVNVENKYKKATAKIKEISSRFSIVTLDPYINNLDWTLLFAGDAIWEYPSYLHGAVAWRMRYNGWRGAYAGDFLGWHDRGRIHFKNYAKSQYIEPDSGPSMPDPEKNFARQKEIPGSAVFTKGYISRYPGRISKPSHYDMNQIFMDQLFYHFQWTGDWEFIKEMWPIIERHLEWEKRCFDWDKDGLYDSYASFWASDAIYYSGGGVTHSSAMNYKANRIASIIAKRIGKDYGEYEKEAEKIKKAVNKILWIKNKGHYAEYKDYLREKLIHPSAGLWTVYHSIETGIGDMFQNYLNTRYVDHEIPHILLSAIGLEDSCEYYLLSTTNWMPYTWSVNNVAMAENVHTALAYWKAYRFDEAFRLFKSAILESGYLGSSPGNFQLLSFYDAFRGELYRDFADPVGITARTLVEGLFGVVPDALIDTLTIIPGFPAEWQSASIFHPSVSYAYEKGEDFTRIKIKQNFNTNFALRLLVKADRENIESVFINGASKEYKILNKVCNPFIEINDGYQKEYDIKIKWLGKAISKPIYEKTISVIDTLFIKANEAEVIDFYDPMNSTSYVDLRKRKIKVKFNNTGWKTVFVLLKQGNMEWWEPIDIEVVSPTEFIYKKISGGNLKVLIKNNSNQEIGGEFMFIGTKKRSYKHLKLAPCEVSDTIFVPDRYLITGRNKLIFKMEDFKVEDIVIDWSISLKKRGRVHLINLNKYYNNKLNNIFKKQYYSPRPDCPTLQIPVQGIGDWCSYSFYPKINDSGLRKMAGKDGVIELDNGIRFLSVGDSSKDNVVFVSKWDNYPDSVYIPVGVKAKHIYLLMAGSTNHMQSRIVNGEVGIVYENDKEEKIELKNPETWWPIEQDYYNDGFAFNVRYPHPLRIYLKTGKVTASYYDVLMKNRTRLIDGGASMVIDAPIVTDEKVKGIYIKAVANEVVIGLLSLTLVY